MSYVKDVIKADIVNHEHMLDRVIRDWDARYRKKLDKLSNKFGIKSRLLYNSDSDSERDNSSNNNKDIACKLIKEALKCKAYAETEYQSIKDIRSELEDCQMIKELGISLRKLEEEKSEQNIKLKALNNKNLELLQEKQNLEKSLLELSLQSKLSTSQPGEKPDKNENNDRRSALTAKLETYTNRTQNSRLINKNPEYCHIAPNINVFSDSEFSVSEEDSLEKDRNPGQNHNDSYHKAKSNETLESPNKFKSGIEHVSKSTPLKEHGKTNGIVSDSRHSNTVSNLTQDLKEIQKYFDKKEDESVTSPTHILDWEMSQMSFEEFRDPNMNGFILEGKEDPDDDQLFPCPDHKSTPTATSNHINSSPNFLHQIDCNLERLQAELKDEKEKYLFLSSHISGLYSLIHKPAVMETGEVPTCSGDRPSTDLDVPEDPVEQICKMKMIMDDKLANDKNTKSTSKSFRSRLISRLLNKNSRKPKKTDKETITNSVECSEKCNLNNSVPFQTKTKPFSDSRLQVKSDHNLRAKRNIKKLSIKEKHISLVRNGVTDLTNGINGKSLTDDENVQHFETSEIKSGFDSDDINTNIFKSLSETSVRLLTEIITNLNKTNQLLSGHRTEFHQNGMKDYTPLVTEYLQYLMSLDSVDFSIDNCRRHPIYDLILELQTNAQNIIDCVATQEKGNVGFSQSLESFYQEQLNKCYDDINILKKQLDSSQQLLTSKLPLDMNKDGIDQWSLLGNYVNYMQENISLFEAKQKLQIELESVDREYARQMAREKKRLEESENLYNELLTDHENMQEKYNEKIIALNQQVEQLERKIESDRRFIDHQEFEWELERTQHNVDIENLNKSIGRVKKSSLSSDNQAVCVEVTVKEKSQKSKSLSKAKFRSFSLESAEISRQENATQTVHKDIMVMKSHLSISDLDKYDEFIELREEIKNNQFTLWNFCHQLSDVIFEIIENNQFHLSLDILQEFNSKDLSEIFKIGDLEWEDMHAEILIVRNFLVQFIEEGVQLKVNFDKIQEELQINITNLAIKQDIIKGLEEEIQSLMEFQKDLSKDYDVLQLMLEEKQNELDAMTAKLLPQQSTEDHEETIRTLKKLLNEKQNVVDERDEDLYVIKEEKEVLEQDLRAMKEKYESIIIQHKDIYQDLEREMKDYQKMTLELQQQIDEHNLKQTDQLKEIKDTKTSNKQLLAEISEMNRNSENLIQKNLSLVDQIQLAELRLIEINEQHKLEVSKINVSLEEIESMNRKLTHENIVHKVMLNTTGCQTELIDSDNVSKESLKSCLNIQDKLIKTIDKLKREYNHEKEMRYQFEAKYRQLTSQYEALSNKVFMLGNSVNDSKASVNQEANLNINQSLESVDINDLLNESQISVDEDIEFNKIIHECCHVESNNEFGRAIATQTESNDKISGLKNNINMFSDVGYSNISDWLPDLLKEVEIVLQSCIMGDDLPREIVPKMNQFRNLLEQMYKNQLSILLNKMSSSEHELQQQRKSNQELKNKFDFIMAELEEKDSVQKNLRLRLEQELSSNNRLSEANRNLSDQNRSVKSDTVSQISHLKDDLDREKNKSSDLSRQLRNEQHRREQIEAVLSVADERIKLVEQSNIELIKKSRQQADYQQKEMDSFNIEYAEIFKRCNNYKIQIEALQQNLQFQVMECEKTKNELQETIQSNTEYRDKMNEFIKIYQDRRKKLETEVNELHQLLQISCRREITFVKENETLRMKCQSGKNICKDYERKIKELENFVSDLHLKHEEDRQDWLNMINGTIDAKDKDDGILSQVNWLLKMLQLRIELLVLHYIPTGPTNGENRTEWCVDAQLKSMFKCRPCSADSTLNRSNSELLMLLHSIKSMQSMINLYLNRNKNQVPQSSNCRHSSDSKSPHSGRSDKSAINNNNLSNRPKPTGSSDSLETISDTDSASEVQESPKFHHDIESLSTKIYIIQTNKIVELQLNLNHVEKWRQQLIEQKKYILSQLSHKLCDFITRPLLTEEQQLIIRRNFFKFKFKSVGFAVIANIKFMRVIQSSSSNITLSSRLNQVGSQLPQPKFSTNIPVHKSSQPQIANMQRNKIHDNSISFQKIQTNPLSKSSVYSTNRHGGESSLEPHSKLSVKLSSSDTHNDSIDSDVENRNQNDRLRCNLNPVASASPVFERANNRPNNPTANSSIPKPTHKSTYSGNMSLSNSFSSSLRRSLPTSANQDHLTNSLDRNSLNKSTNFSNTLKQIDDFGKRLDKYSDVANGV